MKFFKKKDLLIIALLLLLGGGLFAGYRLLAGNQPVRAEIYDQSELVYSVALKEGRDERFSLPGKENVVFHLYEDGSIAFESSDCPDKICVHSGRLRLAGQSAACLPNGLLLKLVSEEERGGENEHDLVI